MNRYTNELIRDQIALLHAPDFTCADATVAAWLVTQAELKLTTRLMSAAWELSAGQGLSLAYQARASALFAAATCNAMLLSREQSLRQMLEQLLPGRATLTASKGLDALLRLFALKDVLQ
ncbi:hypothetical protein L1889_04090 [Paenalcaligenes niemegkensis]|uniref:hypothetical protein n=1 Tax=Paenalcaligenes niemegkensis TaxID=2895469 RepID=UPI001EE99D74|nr:hypothetical protein [Paenalcaligenes niemegkensis]MCQ9615979.1 hypothetical protein [Paenalcaligenes niemegkensis]